MLRRTLALSVFLLVACGKPPAQSAELLPYIQQFNDQYGAYDINAFRVDIEIVDKLDGNIPAPNPLTGMVIGECINNRVEILRGVWILLTNTQQKSLVFHELGHCVFKRVHTDKQYPDGCPLSIMSTDLIEDTCVAKHTAELLAELPIHEQ